MNNKLISAIIFFVFTTLVSGQENSWSVNKCISVGLQNNIEIKIRQLEIKRTEKLQHSVLNRMLPAVTLYGDQSYNFGSTIDPSTNGRVSSNIQNDNFYLNAKMNLIDFSAFANAQKDKINMELAKADAAVIENEYKLQILESYYQALYTQELLKIQKEQFKQSEFNLERITKEVNIGSKPQSDLYDMQLSFSEDESRNMQTEQLYEIQKMQLFQLLNFTAVAIGEIELEREALYEKEQITRNNPKIKRAALQFENTLKTISIERANNLPILSAYYGYSTFYYKNLKMTDPNAVAFFSQLQDNKSQQVGVQLAVPIFNGFRNNKKISASKIESEKTKQFMEQEKQELDKKIALEEMNEQNYIRLKQKLIEKQSYAKASLATTQAKFTNGKIEAILYTTVKNQLLAAEYEVLKNELQIQYTSLRVRLLKFNSL
ncbi:TolC family protein [Flavobacterium sp. I-SCBP12n]|uniref:TolC family protein n=1 Tax=Flavobacterium pygoscelis TaxID=2893176 RepID=A0A9X1XU17_9FLAO|nr:TolC family protein [Flavobacterium pygoscelis]MCK8142716.1 TolC family protein [Flavobacterium pygoscelis]